MDVHMEEAVRRLNAESAEERRQWDEKQVQAILAQQETIHAERIANALAAHKAKQERIRAVVGTLRSLGIDMMVVACSCCDSPTVRFGYLGEVIADNEGLFNFDTRED